jgi:replicative DNA helicase
MQAEANRASPEEEIAFIDKEVDEINRELDLLSNPVPDNRNQSTRNCTDIKSAIDLQGNQGTEINEPVFFNPTQIRSQERNLQKIIPSGIDLLDKRIIGFNPGELSIWSGSNGSGKSSVLSQITINGIDRGFKVAIFSGELRADRVLDWLHLQAAGKRHTRPTQYENYYTVPESVKSKINGWLDGKLYIYNNNLGIGVLGVLKAIQRCIKEQNIRMVIIDNMMSLDLAAVSGEKYEKQTSLVLALSELAKQNNVHIHFVAHPRKSLGFLRKNDISGTADITNAADNVFIVHRVNTDFKRSTKLDMGFKEDNPLYNYSNVIEICKNRDLGIADEFIGLHFEHESKRFLNVKGEERHYKWETDEHGFVKLNVDEKLPFDE